MRSWHRLLITALIGLLALPAAASAKFAATASVATDGTGVRLVVVLSSSTPATGRKAPKSLSATVKGKALQLRKVAGSGAGPTAFGTWRSSVQKGARATAVRALIGKRVPLTVRTAAATKRIQSVAATSGSGGAGGGGTGGSGTGTGGGSTPLFTPLPSSNLTGTAAFNAISGFVANSTITDCPTGWPACGGFERRFGIWSNNAFYDCNLRPTSGSDVLFTGTIVQTTGANFNTDGSWAWSFVVLSTGGYYYAYRLDVGPSGAAVARSWAQNADPAVLAPAETITGLQWLRGAKTCQI